MTDQTAVAVQPESPVVAEGPGALLSAIVTLAKDPTVDVTKLTALMEMQNRMEDRQAARLFNEAFIRLQRRLPRIKKNGTLEYPINKNDPDGAKRKISSFARYEDIDKEIRHLLDEEGFAVSFNTASRQGDGGGLTVTVTLLHAAGHSRDSSIPVPLDTSGGKNNLQGYGSTMKYGQRYALTAALNIVSEDEDDDGKRGGMQFITDEHEREIVGLLQQTRTNPDTFLQMMTSARSTSEIEERDFLRLKNALLQKQAKSRTTPPSDPP